MVLLVSSTPNICSNFNEINYSPVFLLMWSYRLSHKGVTTSHSQNKCTRDSGNLSQKEQLGDSEIQILWRNLLVHGSVKDFNIKGLQMCFYYTEKNTIMNNRPICIFILAKNPIPIVSCSNWAVPNLQNVVSMFGDFIKLEQLRNNKERD